MKYVTPNYEAAVLETEDIITASSDQNPNYEVEKKGNGQGNIIMSAFDLFR